MCKGDTKSYDNGTIGITYWANTFIVITHQIVNKSLLSVRLVLWDAGTKLNCTGGTCRTHCRGQLTGVLL